MKYIDIRSLHYKSQKIKLKKKFGVDITSFFSQPYTFLKSRRYIEIAAILVFFFLRTSISPNSVTLFYCLISFLGGVFIATNDNNLILIGLLIFFFKSSIDWADGLLARIKKQTSNLGELLDEWGAYIGSFSFLSGFGVYIFNKENDLSYLFILLAILILRSLDIKNYFYQTQLAKLINNERSIIKMAEKSSIQNKYKNIPNILIKFKNLIINTFDDRARSVDLICFLIFLDTFYIEITLLKYIFFLLAFKYAVLFIGSFYLIYFKDYIKRLNIK